MDNDFNIKNYRSLVVGVDTKIPLPDGREVTAINFDNAATTPPFHNVLNEILRFSPWYSSIHRGTGYKSIVSSELYENSRYIVGNFVNANLDHDTVIYVKNTTEAINKVAYRLCTKHKKCIILSTDMEHHSNDLPWRNKYKVNYIAVNEQGQLSLQDLEAKLVKYRGKIKLVTVAGASNVTGFKNDIYKIAELSHRYGARILVDGAQLVPHCAVDMKPENSPEHIDFLVFSSHKMYAPFGIGVLIGPRSDFENGEPDYVGGGTVKFVTHKYVGWDDPPNKEEAGTPNIMGVVALISSIQTLNSIGMSRIEKHEKNLTDYALSKLQKIPDVELYGNCFDSSMRVGIIPFNIKGLRHDIVAKALSSEGGIAVRNGCFCAQPYIQKLLNLDKDKLNYYMNNPSIIRPGMVRLSFGIYNSFEEIDIFIRLLKVIVSNKALYINKYG